MAAFDFPNTPSTNDTHTENGVEWVYNGYAWDRVEPSSTIATDRIQEGDTIYYDKHAGHGIQHKDKFYGVIKQQDVVLID